MVKLNDEMAGNVRNADDVVDMSTPLPTGLYPVRLRKVEMRDGKAAAYLNWELEVTEGEYASRRLWTNTSLAKKPFCMSKLKEAYAAFGADPSTDTDEMLGNVGEAYITGSSYNGKETNEVSRLSPLGSTDGGETAESFEDTPY